MRAPIITADFEELDHTADLAMRVRGKDIPSLLANAASGMMRLMTGPLPEGIVDQASDERILIATAPALDELLRQWLSELIYLVATERVMPFEFVILEAEEHRIEVRVRSAVLTDEIANNTSEIKAVTWHGLRVECSEDGFVAEVIFDT
jgi:SHS2 domain-containing protein